MKRKAVLTKFSGDMALRPMYLTTGRRKVPIPKEFTIPPYSSCKPADFDGRLEKKADIVYLRAWKLISRTDIQIGVLITQLTGAFQSSQASRPIKKSK